MSDSNGEQAPGKRSGLREPWKPAETEENLTQGEPWIGTVQASDATAHRDDASAAPGPAVVTNLSAHSEEK
jgi:hypothetical protein